MNNRIALEVGDWSRDGHNQSEVFIFRCTHTQEQVEKLYEQATKILGWDFSEVVAEAYEDNRISVEDANKLLTAGVSFKGLEWEELHPDEGIDDYHLYPELFCEVWLRICKLANPTLAWEVTNDTTHTIKVGGYGLYY